MQQPKTPLELAIASYRAQQHIHTKDRSSMRMIAEDFGVHPSTLSYRLRGVTESYSQGHAYRQALTNDEEHCLLDYIRRMSLLGHPPPPVRPLSKSPLASLTGENIDFQQSCSPSLPSPVKSHITSLVSAVRL